MTLHKQKYVRSITLLVVIVIMAEFSVKCRMYEEISGCTGNVRGCIEIFGTFRRRVGPTMKKGM